MADNVVDVVLGNVELVDAKELCQLERLRAWQRLCHPPPVLADLRYARKALGLKQETLALMLGVAGETISRYENGALEVPRMYVLALRALLLEAK